MVASEEAVVAVVKVLLDEGGAPGHSLHSWRCEYPARYGLCTCLEQTAVLILEALASIAPADHPPGPLVTGASESHDPLA
jgi:hypothetical protein